MNNGLPYILLIPPQHDSDNTNCCEKVQNEKSKGNSKSDTGLQEALYFCSNSHSTYTGIIRPVTFDELDKFPLLQVFKLPSQPVLCHAKPLSTSKMTLICHDRKGRKCPVYLPKIHKVTHPELNSTTIYLLNEPN